MLTQPSPSSKRSLDKTQNYITEHSCPYNTSRYCFLKNAYFLFQDKFNKQVLGAGVVSPIRPSVAKLFMKEFEIKAIITATNSLRICFGYIDDKFAIQKAEYSHQFLQHFNSINHHISLHITPTQMVSYPLWTLWLHLDQTTQYSQQFTGNLFTQTNTFSGTSATTFMQSLVFLLPLHIVQGLFVQTQNCCKRKRNT